MARAVTASAPAARVVETRLAAPGAAAEAAAREPRLAVHAVDAARGEKWDAAAGEGAGFGPLAFAAAFRCRRGRLLLFEGPPHDLVHEGESHPGVGAAAAMDGAPTGVGGQDLGRTGGLAGITSHWGWELRRPSMNLWSLTRSRWNGILWSAWEILRFTYFHLYDIQYVMFPTMYGKSGRNNIFTVCANY